MTTASVNPARAGMILNRPQDSSRRTGKPRASGDDPDLHRRIRRRLR